MTRQNKNTHFHFLDVLRGFAASLVVWSHLFVFWPKQNGITMPITDFIKDVVNSPMGLIQDFGWLGVVIFFLISGFIITHVSQSETPHEFIIKRIFRIFPALIVAITLSLLVDNTLRSQADFGSVISNILLINYWIHPQIIFIGVAWTLAVEILFYALILLCYPLNKRPALKSSVLLVLVAITIHFSRSFGDNFFLFSATMAYIPFLVFGQLFYFVLQNKITVIWQALGLFIFAYGVLLYGLQNIHTAFLPIENSYLVSFFVAITFFLLAHSINEKIRPNRWITLFSETSYSLYLFHGIVGYLVLGTLTPTIGFSSALGVALIAVATFVLLVHRWVEKPMIALSHRLTAKARG
jgi:peptidoglycan/LPS O-acetylase OafA/YrhL